MTKIPHPDKGYVDYRLAALGLRVRKDTCELIERIGDAWEPMGSKASLPLHVPDDLESSFQSTILLIAHHYCKFNPASDLRAVLSRP